MEDVPLFDNDLRRVIKIGPYLDVVVRNELVGFLKMNQDVFTLSHSDMCGISPDFRLENS